MKKSIVCMALLIAAGVTRHHHSLEPSTSPSTVLILIRVVVEPFHAERSPTLSHWSQPTGLLMSLEVERMTHLR
jgi:hypothetical protein